MSDRIPIHVIATDPVLRAGVCSQLNFVPEVEVVPPSAADRARVILVVTDKVEEPVLQTIRRLRRNTPSAIVCVAHDVDDKALLLAVEAGVCGVLRRQDATDRALLAAVQRADAGEGSIPGDMLARLLQHVGAVQRDVLSPRGLNFAGLSEREVEVLRLVADGHSTQEIAEALAFSERTIKSALHDLTTRLRLRNRSHAVAYALREGLI